MTKEDMKEFVEIFGKIEKENNKLVFTFNKDKSRITFDNPDEYACYALIYEHIKRINK